MAKKKESKYKPGRLHLVGFDRLGTKMMHKVLKSSNYIKGQETGQRLIGKGKIHSFVLIRIMYNSLSPGKSW